VSRILRLPSFAVTLSLSVLVLAFVRCLLLRIPGFDYSHGPAWVLYAGAMWRGALEAFIVLVACHLGLRWSRARGSAIPRMTAMLLSIPLAAIALLENRVRVPIVTHCPEGEVCNPYGLELVLESNLHFIVLAAASVLAAFAVGRSCVKADGRTAA
jgi:hypothetical protein